jgi:hypothetical protein
MRLKHPNIKPVQMNILSIIFSFILDSLLLLQVILCQIYFFEFNNFLIFSHFQQMKIWG